MTHFSANVPFNSTLKLDHYDLTLFYGIPFLKTVSKGKLNVELGLNARIIDFKAEISQPQTFLSQSKSLTIPVPMGHFAFQFKPVKKISIDGELKGIAYGSNRYYDVTGRVKFKIVKLLFLSGGYKYQNIKIDQREVKSDLRFGGPLLEIGLEL